MKKIKKIILATVFSLTILIPYEKVYAMPQPTDYNYHNFNYNIVKDHLLNNHAVIFRGSHDKKITLGNEKVAKKYRSRALPEYHLHLHHILFKGIRNTFPAIPYLCMQAPRTHHRQYHNDRENTDINYNSFTNMHNYLHSLLTSITHVADTENDEYSAICIQAANVVVDAQGYWIAKRYSWLHNVNNGRVLLLAQRLLAKDCFPNNIIANKYICEENKEYIISELRLSHYAIMKINSNSPEKHLKSALKARFNMLKIYTSAHDNIPSLNSAAGLSSHQALNLANHRYKDSERFHNPIAHRIDVAGESSDSDASSLSD